MGYLYNAGDQCTSITGGWKTNTSYAINTMRDNGAVEINTFCKNVGSITYNSSNIVLKKVKGNGYGGIMMQTTNAINFVSQGIDSITINCSTSVSGWGYDQTAWDANKPYAWWDIGIIPSFSDGQNLSVYYHHSYDDGYINSAASPIQTRTESFSRTIKGLSKITGSFYVVVGIYRSVDADFSLTVNSITTASAATSNSPKTIWDFNGTTYSKIKTLYDNDGSTSSKIKYVYDNNGSTNSLVYSSEVSALTEYAWGGHYNENGAYQDLTVSNGQITDTTSTYINKSVWTTGIIDLSQFSTMTINYQVTARNSVNGYIHFGVVAHSSQKYTYCGNTQTTSFGTNYGANFNYTHLTVGTHTKSVDISSWTGSKYLGVIIGVGGDGSSMTIKVTSITLE